MTTLPPLAGATPAEQKRFAHELVSELVRRYPRRLAGSQQERQSQKALLDEVLAPWLEGAGLSPRVSWEPFTWNKSLYQNLALHFGLGVAGTALSGLLPGLGLACHLLAGTSYLLDSTRRAFLLRSLLPRVESQNLLITLPAAEEERLRLVFLAHIDAAYTGRMFEPEAVMYSTRSPLPRPLAYLSRPPVLGTFTQFLLAGCDLTRCLLGPLALPLRPLEWALTAPGVIGLGLALEVVLRDELVPGAVDNLSGVATMALLMQRLAPHKPADVTLSFVVTGAEEAGTGGANRLAAARQGRWDPRRTVVVALDSVGNGELRYVEEGEIQPQPLDPELRRILEDLARNDPRFVGVQHYTLPVGATDATPFWQRGYATVAFGCEDPELGAARHYHLPSDAPENLDVSEIPRAVDLIDAMARRLYPAESEVGR